jgi:hypothetical protein
MEQFLTLFISTYEAYHNHKETSAYTIAIVQSARRGRS